MTYDEYRLMKHKQKKEKKEKKQAKKEFKFFEHEVDTRLHKKEPVQETEPDFATY